MSRTLIEAMTVTRPCGGTVELFKLEYPDNHYDYAVRYTAPSGKQYAGGRMVSERVARAIANNWAHGQTVPPFVHILDGKDWA